MSQFDLVIRGATIVDGSGGEPFEGDVAVKDGRIAAVGQVVGNGAEEIDASGRIVTPGFIDVHTHYDGQITWENRLQPSSDHGVTTVVMGNCGVGFAPVRPGDHNLVIRLMEGVEDIPDVVMEEGVPFNWESFPDYLDALDKRESDIDFCAQLPHSPLRVYVMGKRGADLEPPTEADLAEMRRLTAEAVKAGALGVTTSRTIVHRFRTGELAPSVPTEEAEVLALAAGLRDAGTGNFQIVPNYDVEPKPMFDLMRRLATESGRPLSFTFMQVPQRPDGWRYLLSEIDRANDDGLEIRGQVIPRPTGGLMGLELSLHPFALNPSFRAIEHLPLAEKVAAMRDPALRARLIAEQPQDPHDFFKFFVSEKDMLYRLGDPPNYNPSADESVGAMARAQGRDPNEVIYDILLEKDGHEILYRPMGNIDETPKFEGAGRNMVDSEHTVIALGDGGAHYSMICDAAITTYFLTYWVRDAAADRKVPLARAVRMLSREPAELAGLRDRGLVRPGYKADLNVIDLDRLRLHAPHASYDLPTGGRRLSQKADGYEATIVSGVVTYRNGVASGALPGRLQRHLRPDPVAA
jgi:N-acyl-D-aspartate/D-glutamate deacylase